MELDVSIFRTFVTSDQHRPSTKPPVILTTPENCASPSHKLSHSNSTPSNWQRPLIWIATRAITNMDKRFFMLSSQLVSSLTQITDFDNIRQMAQLLFNLPPINSDDLDRMPHQRHRRHPARSSVVSSSSFALIRFFTPPLYWWMRTFTLFCPRRICHRFLSMFCMTYPVYAFVCSYSALITLSSVLSLRNVYSALARSAQ